MANGSSLKCVQKMRPISVWKMKSSLPVHCSFILCDKNVVTHGICENNAANPKIKAFNNFLIHKKKI